jgi:hypothetical protein
MPGVEFWCAELSSKNLMVIRLILAALHLFAPLEVPWAFFAITLHTLPCC